MTDPMRDADSYEPEDCARQYGERPENNVWAVGAADARRAAKKHFATAKRERDIRSGITHGAAKETRFRQYVMACVIAAELRAETERRIAAMFEDGERAVYSRTWERNT